MNARISTAFLMLCAAGSSALAADAPAAPYTVTGHIDLVSRYYLRGATTTYGNALPTLGNKIADAPESDRPAVQGGLDFVHESGFYAGWFASTINYSYKQLGKSYGDRSIIGGFQDDKSVENDFYAGYNGKAGDLGYTAGLTGYYYINGKHANAFETKLGLSYGDFAFSAQTLLSDVVWGNKGDTYVTLNYTHALPYKITFLGSLGGYLYRKEGKFLGTTDTLTGAGCGGASAFVVNGCYAGSTPISSGFRHLVLGFTQPILDTPFTWGLQAIIAGKTRFGIKQENKLVASISYGF